VVVDNDIIHGSSLLGSPQGKERKKEREKEEKGEWCCEREGELWLFFEKRREREEREERGERREERAPMILDRHGHTLGGGFVVLGVHPSGALFVAGETNNSQP